MALSLKDIKRGPELKPYRMVLYGVPGIGKTTFAAQSPSPIFVQTEDGLGTLDYDRFPVSQNFDQVIEALQSLLKDKHEYKTVVIDTLDLLESLIHQDVAKAEKKQSIADIGYQKGYVTALNYFNYVLQYLNQLRDERGMNSILLAHSLVKKHDAPDTEAYDRYRLHLHDKAADLIFGWAEIVLFANYKVQTYRGKDGSLRGAGEMAERFLFTQERPAHWGKNRFGLPYEIPFNEETGYSDFAKILTESAERKMKVSKPEKQQKTA